MFGTHFKLAKEFIVSKTANRIILHVWSQQKIQEILTLANESASKVDREDHVYYLCGKVDIRKHGRSSSAYIIRETEATFTILHRDNELEVISKDGFEYNQGNYVDVYDKLRLAYKNVKKAEIEIHKREGVLPVAHLGDGNKPIIEWVYPMRIVIMRNLLENFRIYSPFICYTKDNGNIVETLSACKFIILYIYCSNLVSTLYLILP